MKTTEMSKWNEESEAGEGKSANKLLRAWIWKGVERVRGFVCGRLFVELGVGRGSERIEGVESVRME